MKKYKFLEHTADVKFQAFGDNIEEAFENSATAMFSVMADLKKIKSKNKIKIKASASNNEELLIEWLNNLLAQADMNNLIFSEFKVKIKDNKLTGEAQGEKLDTKKHEIKLEVKAATYSELFVKKEKNKYTCQVVLDV